MPSDARLLLLAKNEVEALLLHDDVLRAVREAFVLHSQGEGRVFPLVREPLITGAYSASSRGMFRRKACSASRRPDSGQTTAGLALSPTRPLSC